MQQISKQCHFPPLTEECEIIEDGKIERRRRMEQISKQCHLPPRTQKDFQLTTIQCLDNKDCISVQKVSQQTRDRSHFTTGRSKCVLNTEATP